MEENALNKSSELFDFYVARAVKQEEKGNSIGALVDYRSSRKFARDIIRMIPMVGFDDLYVKWNSNYDKTDTKVKEIEAKISESNQVEDSIKTVGNILETMGMFKEANVVDTILKKIAQLGIKSKILDAPSGFEGMLRRWYRKGQVDREEGGSKEDDFSLDTKIVNMFVRTVNENVRDERKKNSYLENKQGFAKSVKEAYMAGFLGSKFPFSL